MSKYEITLTERTEFVLAKFAEAFNCTQQEAINNMMKFLQMSINREAINVDIDDLVDRMKFVFGRCDIQQ